MRQQIYGFIVDEVIEKIKTGVYKENEKLPSEKQFCKIYGASQSTVKKALKELADLGFITAVERIGYYVSPPVTNEYHFIYDYPNLSDNIKITETQICPPVKVDIDIPGEQNSESRKALMIKESYKCSKTVLTFRKLYVLYNRGILSKKHPLDESFANAILDQLKVIGRKTKIDFDFITTDETLMEEMGVRVPTEYYRLIRWDYDEYGRIMSYSINYIHAEHFEIHAKSEKSMLHAL